MNSGIILPERVYGVDNGTFQSSIVTWTDGILANATNYTRDGYVSIGEMYDGTEIYSFSTWFDVPSVIDKNRRGMIIMEGYRPEDKMVGLGDISGLCSDELIAIFTGREDRVCYTSDSDTILPGWHHLVLVWNSNENDHDIYLDGVEKPTIINGAPSLLIADDVKFGTDAGGDSWQGKIDETGFWNRSLTLEEVGQLFNNGDGITYGPCLGVDDDNDGFNSCIDCNDDDADINPGAAERCNLIDDNCNIFVDEGIEICREFICNDGIDNDLDGFTDRKDQDCNLLSCRSFG